MAWFPFVLVSFSTSAALEAIRIPGMAATREEGAPATAHPIPPADSGFRLQLRHDAFAFALDSAPSFLAYAPRCPALPLPALP